MTKPGLAARAAAILGSVSSRAASSSASSIGARPAGLARISAALLAASPWLGIARRLDRDPIERQRRRQAAVRLRGHDGSDDVGPDLRERVHQ